MKTLIAYIKLIKTLVYFLLTINILVLFLYVLDINGTLEGNNIFCHIIEVASYEDKCKIYVEHLNVLVNSSDNLDMLEYLKEHPINQNIPQEKYYNIR